MAQFKYQENHFGFKTKEEHLAHVLKRRNNAKSKNAKNYWNLLASEIERG